MNCPRCGAEYTTLKSVKLISEGMNKFDRKTLIFQAEHDIWVEWKDGKYHCKKCGLAFTYKEGVLQIFSKRVF